PSSQIELLHLVTQGVSRDPQKPRGLGLIALVFSRARANRLRSLSSSERPSLAVSAAGAAGSAVPDSEWATLIGRLGVVIRADSSRIMARSIALRSSRTLPGQSCDSSSFAAASLTPSMLRRNLWL